MLLLYNVQKLRLGENIIGGLGKDILVADFKSLHYMKFSRIALCNSLGSEKDGNFEWVV